MSYTYPSLQQQNENGVIHAGLAVPMPGEGGSIGYLTIFTRQAGREFGEDVPDMLYKGAGCRNCQGTGYRGRQGVFELMPINEELRELILDHASAGQVRTVATRQGMRGLRQDGLRHVREGRTTIEEVLRVTKDETSSVAGEALGMTAERV